MSIITISRSFCSKGELIAEQVANELGYECISRKILLEASEHFNIPEIKLARAIHDGPSMFEKFNHGKEKYISYIRASLLNHLAKDNVVYHGLAGHFFIQNIPNILKVRVLSDMKNRIQEEMERNNNSANVARKKLLQDDKERLRWSTYMYNIDTSDPELYDMMINLKNMSIKDSVKIILNAVELKQFQTSEELIKTLKNEAISATIKAAIIEDYGDAKIKVNNGKVYVDIECPVSDPEKAKSVIHETLEDIKDISSINVIAKSSRLSRTAMHNH